MIGVNPIFRCDYTTFNGVSKLNTHFVATFTFDCYDGMSGGVHSHIEQSTVAINATDREIVFLHDKPLAGQRPAQAIFVYRLRSVSRCLRALAATFSRLTATRRARSLSSQEGPTL